MKAISLFSTLAISLGLTVTCALPAWAGQIRNQKTVVEGKIYRAGTTKQLEYNDETLEELCEDGFTVAIYLYKGARARTVPCGGGRSISYLSMANYQDADRVLNKIGEAVNSGGKAIFHCWNGIHATGFIAAASLRRFCGFNGSQAETYFRNGFKRGTISDKSANSLAGILQALPNGGTVLQGCPNP